EPASPCQRLIGRADREPEAPIGEDRGQDEADQPAFAPHVEEQACDQQDGIPRGPGRDGVRREDHGQEEEKEDRRRKDHELWTAVYGDALYFTLSCLSRRPSTQAVSRCWN